MTTAEPNAERRSWLGIQLEHAAGVLGVTTVPKPQLLTALDWSEGDCQLRAELITLAPSPVGILRPDVINDVRTTCSTARADRGPICLEPSRVSKRT